MSDYCMVIISVFIYFFLDVPGFIAKKILHSDELAEEFVLWHPEKTVCPVRLKQYDNDPEVSGFSHVNRTVCLSSDVSRDIGDGTVFNYKSGCIV